MGVPFKCHKSRKFESKNAIFFVKREMPILFPVNCERNNLVSVKRDLDLSLPPSSISAYHINNRKTNITGLSGSINGVKL